MSNKEILDGRYYLHNSQVEELTNMTIWDLTGWGLWVVVAMYSFSGVVYVIGGIRSGSAVTHAGLFQLFSAICVCFLFVLYPWNKNVIAAVIPCVWLLSFTAIGQMIGRTVGHISKWFFSPLFRR